MNTWVTVARYHLARPASYLVPVAAFPVSLAVGAGWAARGLGDDQARWLVSVVFAVAMLGMQTIGRSLPFGLMLGASRRSFYSGTALLGMALALVYGLVLTALQAIERATGGWGLSVHIFRVPYLLNGPWFVTWLTSAVALFAVFVYGMWYGILHHRWGRVGTWAFIAVQALVVVAGGRVVSVEHGHVSSSVGGSFAGLSALGLTGVIAALAAVLLAGGRAAIRRVTV